MRSPKQSAISWRIYPLSTTDQQHHIEQGEQLLNTIQPGDAPVLYWSQAASPTLVLGFSQREETLNVQALTRYSIPVYHRRAGGTAVLAGPHLLGLDVVLPAGHPLVLADIVESYRWLGETWVAAFQKLALPTRVVSPTEAHAQHDRRKRAENHAYESLMYRACYGTLSPYEVVYGQSKVVGLDMIRRRAGSLLQAGILLHWETDLLAQLLGTTPEEQEILRVGLSERAIGLDKVAGRAVTAQEVIAAFHQALSC